MMRKSYPARYWDSIVAFGQRNGLANLLRTERDRADVLEFNPDGTGFRIFASGLRNCVGMAINPVTGALWCSTKERDGLGDNLPPDYITSVQPGGFTDGRGSTSAVMRTRIIAANILNYKPRSSFQTFSFRHILLHSR
jgi:hypothetical protein